MPAPPRPPEPRMPPSCLPARCERIGALALAEAQGTRRRRGPCRSCFEWSDQTMAAASDEEPCSRDEIHLCRPTAAPLASSLKLPPRPPTTATRRPAHWKPHLQSSPSPLMQRRQPRPQNLPPCPPTTAAHAALTGSLIPKSPYPIDASAAATRAAGSEWDYYGIPLTVVALI